MRVSQYLRKLGHSMRLNFKVRIVHATAERPVRNFNLDHETRLAVQPAGDIWPLGNAFSMQHLSGDCIRGAEIKI